jgi:hypothetical protein
MKKNTAGKWKWKGKERRRGVIAPIYDRLVKRKILPDRRKSNRKKTR